MLVTCPRCGFEQPKDRFCASCGIDIDAFRPAPDPFLRKVVMAPAFQLSLLVLVVGTLTLWIYFEQKRRLAQLQTSTLAQQLSPSTTEPAPEPAESKNPASDFADSPAGKAPGLATASSESLEEEPQTSAASATPGESATKAAPPATIPTQMEIRFVEATRPLLDRLFNTAKTLSESASVAVLSLPQTKFNEISREREEYQSLPGGRKVSLSNDTPISLHFPMPPGPREVEEQGLSLQIRPTRVAANSMDLILEGFIVLRGATGARGISTNISGQFTISPDDALIITGFAPHAQPAADQLERVAGTPLMIYKSDHFLRQSTDLIIVIQAK